MFYKQKNFHKIILYTKIYPYSLFQNLPKCGFIIIVIKLRKAYIHNMENQKIDYIGIGKRIKEKRIGQNMTQERLGELSELSIAHISHIENGHTKLSIESLVNIANALGTSADDLLQDNLTHNEIYYHEKISNVVSDCSADEIKDLSHVIAYFKEFIRNRRLYK